MEIYLVGGAVRDKLLNLPVIDNDWVVVGSTPDELLSAGYRSVGKDFPVFLHPETHEEYALARTERKTGPGYHGFTFNTDKNVTLEDDLLRRDLTINAIAQKPDGTFVDPFNGIEDIENRTLRHVSDAFKEDPVRVLRVAKFKARFAHRGFAIAKETNALMQSMVDNGEVDNLVAERVWAEMDSALSTTTPVAFYQTLVECGALNSVMPELSQLLLDEGYTLTADGQRALNILNVASERSDDASVRFAALCTEFGAKEKSDELEAMCHRLRVPGNYKDLAMLGSQHARTVHNLTDLNADELYRLIKVLDVSRKPERFNDFLTVCECDAHIRRAGNKQFTQTSTLRSLASVFLDVDAGAIAQRCTNKADIATAVAQAQTDAINQYLINLNR
jgi:tRNA nucleotidyltransferase (CCA-adding enzyme)